MRKAPAPAKKARAAVPAVSIVLTSYDRPELIGEAVGSVLAQTFEDWHLLILDDGSPRFEEIEEVITPALFDSRVEVHWFEVTEAERQESVRYCELINWGVAHSDSEFVAYLVDDDWWLPDHLEKCVKLLREGHDVVWTGQQLCEADRTVWGHRHANHRLTTEALGVVDHSAVMHTRAAFNTVEGWPTDRQYWRIADGMFFNSLIAAGYGFEPTHAVTAAKRYHNAQIDARIRAGLDPWSPVVPVGDFR